MTSDVQCTTNPPRAVSQDNVFSVVEAVRRCQHDEAARLAALEQYDIFDTPPEQSFDDVVYLAAHVCQTPVALVGLIAADRQWYKARVGLDVRETPLEQTICVHALRQSGLLVIPDLAQDPRTRDNASITGGLRLRFYAGVRLETPDGIGIGTLCVIDTKPRPAGLTEVQVQALQALARQVMGQLELRQPIAKATKQ